MHTTYHLKANELNDNFLQSIKTLFQNQASIKVSDIRNMVSSWVGCVHLIGQKIRFNV